MPTQNFAILQVAGKQRMVKCDEIGVKIVDFVDTLEGVDPATYDLQEVAAQEVGTWAIVEHGAAPEDSQELLRRTNELVAAHTARLQKDRDEFKRMATRLAKDPNAQRPLPKKEAPADDDSDGESKYPAKVSPPPHDPPHDRYAVVSVLRGEDAAIMPLGMWPTEDECAEWVRKTLGPLYAEYFDLFVVPVGTWFFPQQEVPAHVPREPGDATSLPAQILAGRKENLRKAVEMQQQGKMLNTITAV